MDEALVAGGDLLAPGPGAAGRFASLLAELVGLAPDPAVVPTLRPSPAWAAWDHDHPGLWPPPDDRAGDLDDHPGPAWLDRVAAAVWPAAGGPGEAATVEQTEAFLAAYERARGRPWTPGRTAGLLGRGPPGAGLQRQEGAHGRRWPPARPPGRRGGRAGGPGWRVAWLWSCGREVLSWA
jgi:hypothetical protein